MSECLFTMNSYLLAACWSGAIIHSYVCQSQVASGLECVAEWLKPAMEADMSQWQRDQQVRFEEEWLEAWPFCLLFVVLVVAVVVVVVVAVAAGGVVI